MRPLYRTVCLLALVLGMLLFIGGCQKTTPPADQPAPGSEAVPAPIPEKDKGKEDKSEPKKKAEKHKKVEKSCCEAGCCKCGDCCSCTKKKNCCEACTCNKKK